MTWLVFPIRSKILKPRFQMAEKKPGKTHIFLGCEINMFLLDENNVILKLLLLFSTLFTDL